MENLRYDYPFPGEWKLNIPIKVVLSDKQETLDLSVEYKQANIEDTIKFLQILKDEKKDTTKWFFEFLREFGNLDDTMEKILSMNEESLKKIFNTVLDTRFRGVFQKKGKNKSNGDSRMTLYSTQLTNVSSSIGIHPKELQKEYTLEQFNRMVEGINFGINEQSEKGRKRNDAIAFNKKYNDEDLIEMLK